jgi:restriction endonuclease S subunit
MLINPDYLCWILNREDTLSFLRANAFATSMPSVSKSLMEKYKINVPSIHVQNKIIEIAGLQEKEKHLYEAILCKRNKIIQSKLIEITKK